MMSKQLKESVELVASYFEGHKVGYEGTEGFRKTTDLAKLARCIEELLRMGLLDPKGSVFMDLGAGDGRVNLLMSYFVRLSIGIEIHPEILEEYDARSAGLRELAGKRTGFVPWPDNIYLFRGDSLSDETYERILAETGISFGEVDIFYTYITLHDLFAERIAALAKPGAVYMVYGFSSVVPKYDGLELLEPDLASQNMVILFRKAKAPRRGIPSM